MRHCCSHVFTVGDLNHQLEQAPYESLLGAQGLTDHVSFPTHVRGGTLDPAITDMQEGAAECHQLGTVGSSDYYTVLTQVHLSVARDEVTTLSVWLWEQADWPPLFQALHLMDLCTLLSGRAEHKA